MVDIMQMQTRLPDGSYQVAESADFIICGYIQSTHIHVKTEPLKSAPARIINLRVFQMTAFCLENTYCLSYNNKR